MNDPVANTQLELACRLGVLENVIEALDDGADIDCNGCSPVYFAIENGERSVLEALVERGAAVAMFEVDESGDVVEQLLQIGSPAAPKKDEVGTGMIELDAKMIRAFDRMLRNKGVAEPIVKNRFAEYQAFCDALGSLAAEECQAVVSEFLKLIKSADGDTEETVKGILADDGNTEKIEQLSQRYAKVTAEELPGELLKDYLKEGKKVS